MTATARLAPSADSSEAVSANLTTQAPASPNAAKTRPFPSDAFTFAQSVAAKLTPANPWIAERWTNGDGTGERDIARLVRRSDGATLRVELGGYRNEGRVHCAGMGPRFANGDVVTWARLPETSCDASREPASLARDIERRLLTHFDPMFAEALARVRTEDRAVAEATECGERLAQATGGHVFEPAKHGLPTIRRTVMVTGTPTAVGGLQVRAASGDSPMRVSFEVRDLDEATALRVLALLAEPTADTGASR